MKKWYDLVNTETQCPVVGVDSARLLTAEEAYKKNKENSVFKWVCIDSIFYSLIR